MKRFQILPLLILLAFASCTRTVYVPVMRPAPVDVGSHIKSVAVVDRTVPEDTTAHIVESVITGSLPGLNREAAQRSIEGLVRTLENAPRYGVVRVPERLTNPEIRGNWPPLLSWDSIESIAGKYDTDAVLVLESFSSDLIVTDGKSNLRPPEERGTLLRRDFHTRGIARVKLGYRLYDVQTKTIADEFMFTHDDRWESSGNIIEMAVGQSINHRHLVNDVGFHAGIMYAERISPRWIRLNREFFTKGRFNNNFKIGVRRATVNDWNGAMDAWYRSVNSNYRKTAGRSAFNLALMYEIHGDLVKARDWAQTAYTDYGIRKARKYVSDLERRMRQEAVTDHQLR